MLDKSNVIAFTPHPRLADGAQASTGPALRRRRAHPVTSLAMALRTAPPELQPAAVASDLLATRSNALALPIWNERRSAFRKLLAQRRVSPAELIRLTSEFRAAVRKEGIALKSARRQGEAAAFRVFDEIALGPDFA